MLDKNTLATTIENIMRTALTQDEDGIAQYAQQLAAAIDAYVKGSTIVYLSGLTSATGGAVAGTFEGNLE